MSSNGNIFEQMIANSRDESSNIVLYYSIPVFLVIFALELAFVLFVQKKEYNAKDTAANIVLGLGSAVLNTFIKIFYFFIFVLLYQFRIFEFDNSAWWALILLVLGDDLSFYWAHRSSHEIRLLWAAHENHHSSEEFNFGVAVRQSWTEYFYKYLFWLWLPLSGFNPVFIMWAIAINLSYQFFVHTKVVKKLGFLEWFMNTPSHHRVHHASNFKYLDKNHAGMFIIWDRLFGTFQEELDEEPVVYGTTVKLNTYNPIRIVAHGYVTLWQSIKSAPRWKDKFRYLINPPGWSHDDSTLTVKEMKNRGMTDFEDNKKDAASPPAIAKKNKEEKKKQHSSNGIG